MQIKLIPHANVSFLFFSLFLRKRAKGRNFLFCAREAPKSRRRRKRKGEKERAKRSKVGDEKKAMVALLVFIVATLAIVFSRKKKLFDGRGLSGG